MPLLRLLRQPELPVRVRDVVGESCETGIRKLLRRTIQAAHTGDRSTVGITCRVRGDSIVELVFVVAGCACFGFCGRIMGYFAPRFEKARLRRVPPKEAMPVDDLEHPALAWRRVEQATSCGGPVFQSSRSEPQFGQTSSSAKTTA
jgi:hypothetical protein